MPPPKTTAELVELIAQSGLAEETTIVEAAGPEHARLDPIEFANRLIDLRILTRFQADRLLEGRWRYLRLGDYKVLRPLAAGGSGQVFLCSQTGMDRLAAVKVLPSEVTLDPAALRRFFREARAAGAMDHPNIVRAYDVGQDGSVFYLGMEYLPGATLGELVREIGPLRPEQAAECGRQAAVGLAHAHAAGWAHRDVKPDNLLLTPTGLVKLLDLGLAKLVGDSSDRLTQETGERAILGTIDFLSPEQVQNLSGVDFRTDQYSLGATIFWLAAGKSPVPPGTAAEKIVWHVTQDAPPLDELAPGTPEGMAAVVTRMMARDPTERYPTMTAAANALAEWAGGPNCLAGLTGEPEEPVQDPLPRRRGNRSPRRWLLAVPLGVLLLGGIVAGVAVSRSRPATEFDPAAEGLPRIAPAEAETYLGRHVVVEMVVESSALSADGQSVFLNSQPNFQEPGNITVLIPKSTVPRFLHGTAKDVRKFFHGKRIEVRGQVQIFNDRPEIVVHEPDVIRTLGDG